MMEQLRLALGDTRIVGQRYPQFERQLGEMLEQRPDESATAHEYRMWCFDTFERAQIEQDRDRALDANGEGFYECRWTMPGLRWDRTMGEQLSGDAAKVVKVVCQGLRHSNPYFIDRIILMLRHPIEIARSFERLRQGRQILNAEERRSTRVPLPANYIDAMADSAEWLLENDLRVLPMEFGELVQQPRAELAEVRSFLGEGDFEHHSIEPKSKRAEQDWTGVEADPLWLAAERIYEAMSVADFRAAAREREVVRPLMDRERVTVRCARSGHLVDAQTCELCRQGGEYVEKNRRHAEAVGLDWRNAPCAWDCLYADKPITVDESIAANHWVKQ